jgi:hypothetical protein
MRRTAYSMDGAAKPYMSQPMLGLTLARQAEAEDRDAESASDGSVSPVRSEGGNANRVSVNGISNANPHTNTGALRLYSALN